MLQLRYYQRIAVQYTHQSIGLLRDDKCFISEASSLSNYPFQFHTSFQTRGIILVAVLRS